MVFSRKARAKMPLGWVGRRWPRNRSEKQAEEDQELKDGMSLICYLLAAMIATLLWLAALVMVVLGYH